MKINFSEMTQRNACIVLFLFASLLERSVSPLLLLPLLLQQKRSLSGKIAEVKTGKDRNSDTIQHLQQQSKQQQSKIIGLQHDQKLILLKVDNCAGNSDFLEVKNKFNSLDSKIEQQQKAIKKQQDKINLQQSRQNLMLSKDDKLANRIGFLERDVNSIQEMLKPVPSKVVPIQRRTLFAIDSANLDHAAKTLGIKIDYERLKRYVNTRFGSLEARIYVGEYANNSNQKIWFKYLRDRGYVIETKPVVWHGDTPKANVDLDLALDVRDDGVNFKNVVLCSGDGDYLPLVKRLKKRGIKVIVMNLPSQTSRRLREVADEYVSLSEIKGEVSDRRQA